MPVISVKLANTQTEKRKELIEKLTDAAAEVTKIPKSSFTVFIEEYDLENIGVGGQTLKEKFASG